MKLNTCTNHNNYQEWIPDKNHQNDVQRRLCHCKKIISDICTQMQKYCETTIGL